MSSNSKDTAHTHVSGATYIKVALILTIVTIAEVWGYHIPAFAEASWFIPALLFLTAVKFLLVVLFYMHLKFDHPIFKALFTGPLIVATITIIALMFLFHQLSF